MNAVSQQSCNSHGRSRSADTGRGERLIARCTSAAATRPPLPQDICSRLLLSSGAGRSTVNMTLHAAMGNLIRDAVSSSAVISVSCDGHCVVEYRESRSPVCLGISRYGDPPNSADLLDRDIGDMDRHTSSSGRCFFVRIDPIYFLAGCRKRDLNQG